MREYCTSGSVRGAPGNRCPYRGAGTCTAAIAREEMDSIAPSSRPPVDSTTQGFSDYMNSLWSDFSRWIVTIHTDVPVFILTTVIVVLTVLLLYYTRRLWWAEKRKLPSPVSLRIWKVKEFDLGTVVGAYRAQGITEYLPISRNEDIARAVRRKI
jgi:hypothetical protein